MFRACFGTLTCLSSELELRAARIAREDTHCHCHSIATIGDGGHSPSCRDWGDPAPWHALGLPQGMAAARVCVVGRLYVFGDTVSLVSHSQIIDMLPTSPAKKSGQIKLHDKVVCVDGINVVGKVCLYRHPYRQGVLCTHASTRAHAALSVCTKRACSR